MISTFGGRIQKCVLTAGLVLAAGLLAETSQAEPPRRPEALLLVDDGARLLAANRQTGTISEIDVKARRLVGEALVARGLSDLRATADPRLLLAVDPEAGEAILVSRREGTIERKAAVAVAADPVRAVVLADGRSALVLSRWSRTATFLAWSEPEDLRVVGRLDLPFSPREALVLPGSPSRAVATDAYGGGLAILDLESRTLRRTWKLPDHNLRAPTLCPDGSTVAILAQNASAAARTSREDVEWGVVVRSWIRLVPIDALISEGADADETLEARSRTAVLAFVGRGSADPCSLAFGPKGEVVAAMTGADELASSLGMGEPYERFPVGRGPSALAIDAQAATAYTADAFDDAVTIVDLVAGKVLGAVGLSADAGPDGRRKRTSLLEEGASLFHDAGLSEDSWMSCQTCHTDGHTAGVLIDTQGDGTYGAAKRTPSLRGVSETSPYGWLGNVRRLEDQIHKSITTTMHGPDPTPRQVQALTAYLETLSPPPVDPPADPAALARGRELFDSGRCDACHTAPTYTTPMRFDVGLSDALGAREFNPPSLRGVGRRPRLLHDGSAASLEDLFRRVKHPDEAPMTDDEIADLTAFLRSL